MRLVCPLEIAVEHREGADPSEWVVTRTTHAYDVFGNTTRVHNEGVVSRGGAGCGVCERETPQGEPCGLQCTGDELITDTEFATPDAASHPWILRMPYRVQTRTVDGRGFATLFGYDDRYLLLTSETLTGFEGPEGA